MRTERVPLGGDDDPVSPEAAMSLLVSWPNGRPRGVAVVVHGRNGAAEAPHMRLIASGYLARGYVVVAPDCCGSAHNASAGAAADFVIGEHLRDAGRAADWALAEAAARGWAGGDVALAGHSMGAYAAGMLAATRLRERTRHLLLVSPFVSGRDQLAARAAAAPDGLLTLGRDLPQALFDWPRHDLLRHAGRILCPAATVVGVRDTVTPEASVRRLHDALPRPVAHRVLDGAHHCLEGGPHHGAFVQLVEALDAAARDLAA